MISTPQISDLYIYYYIFISLESTRDKVVLREHLKSAALFGCLFNL